MDWFYLSLSLSIKTVARKTRELNMVSLVCSSCRVCMASHASERELTKKEIVETALRERMISRSYGLLYAVCML